MEPDRHLDLGRPVRRVLHGFEERQAFLEMLQRVVLAMGLGVAGQHAISNGEAGACGMQALPGAVPGCFED